MPLIDMLDRNTKRNDREWYRLDRTIPLSSNEDLLLVLLTVHQEVVQRSHTPSFMKAS